MINIEEAWEIILRDSRTFGDEVLPLRESLGRVLSENIFAERDYPPFHRSAMDGYACRTEDLDFHKVFEVLENIHAGYTPQKEIIPGTCSKIMTGAPLPEGADVVIKVEESVSYPNSKVGFNITAIQPWTNIARQGEDARKDDLLIEKGAEIHTGVYSTLAALGISEVSVCKLPSVSIISTGTELRQVGEGVLPHQIRDSNSYSIESFFSQYKMHLQGRYLVRDSMEEMQSRIYEGLRSDILVLSGGVSMGDADYVPASLKQAGIQELFHKVAIKPGKPLWFGIGPEGQAVFALPGNPLSVQVALKLFIEPYLRSCFGLPPRAFLQLPLSVQKKKKTSFDEFFPCRLINDKGTEVVPANFNGSGDISAMLGSDGFAWHSRTAETLEEGQIVSFFYW
jgi:molybdopterin molybdotransferase